MKCFVPFILALVLIAAEGKVVPASDVENQQTGTQTFEASLADSFREAQNTINTLGAKVQELLPNHDEFLNTFKEHSTNLANNVNEYIKNMTEEYQRATSST